MKLIAAICGFEEEQFIQPTVESLCQNVVDLDAIHFHDGAWLKGGYSPISQDMTKKLFEETCRRHSMTYIWTNQFLRKPSFELADGFYRTQGEKRNHQLQIIDMMQSMGRDWAETQYYVLVIDGDEEIFAKNIKPFKLKPTLQKIFPNCGIINAYGYNQDRAMGTLRLIPGGRGIHYHTEKTMRVHDHKCNVIMDYEHGIKGANLVTLPGLKIENKWQIRNKERLAVKIDYVQFRQSQPISPCKFQRS